MAGVVSLSDGRSWYVNGWGWRQLMEAAIQTASSQDDADLYSKGLYLQGVSFRLMDPAVRVRAAESLRTAALSVATQYRGHEDGYEADYIERLDALTRLLEDEVARNA